MSNPTYFGQVYPFIDSDYFDGSSRIVFDLIKKHYIEHDGIPTATALEISLDRLTKITQVDYDTCLDTIRNFDTVPEDISYIVSITEQFCKERAMHNAISESIRIQENAELPIDERDNRIPDVGTISDLMKKALAVGFSFDVGHDYLNDVEARWKLYKLRTAKIPFSVKMLNIITKGGVERKTLNLLMAGVNVGKSLGLCSLAADYLLEGLNVLYISMEMAEEVVGKRIDANLLGVSMDDIDDGLISETDFMNRFGKLREKSIGKLHIKQFPTGNASVIHFNNLLAELKLKQNFTPDVVIVDYLGIMSSSRMKFSENSYTLVKAIAEELRGFAIEHNVVVWSAAQTTRSGWNNSDVQMGDIAESAGLAATCDFLLALMETDELAEMNQFLCKQIKSRYGDKNKWNKFNLGVDKGQQRLSHLDAQELGDVSKVNVAQVQQAKENLENRSALAKMDKLASLKSASDDINWE
ncbi:MAG: DnaB-like helicase C-terminal domain-containing protein [Culicoidibacterales bacterium]